VGGREGGEWRGDRCRGRNSSWFGRRRGAGRRGKVRKDRGELDVKGEGWCKGEGGRGGRRRGGGRG